MKSTTTKSDSRPRFGWTTSLDSDPQRIYEKPAPKGHVRRQHEFPVAVIRLPFMSAKIRKCLRAFAADLIGDAQEPKTAKRLKRRTPADADARGRAEARRRP